MLPARPRRQACGVAACLVLLLASGLLIVLNRGRESRHRDSRSGSGIAPKVAAAKTHGAGSGAARAGVANGADVAGNPGWAVPFGAEFWHENGVNGVRRASGGAKIAPSRIASSVIDRVSHAFVAETGTRGLVRGEGYEARVESNGFRFSPSKPVLESQRDTSDGTRVLREGDVENAEAVVRTTSMRRGQGAPVVFQTESLSWVVRGNTAQALLDSDSGVVEHVEAGTSGVELTWVLPRPLDGDGDLALDAIIEGLGSMRQTDSGLHFFDAEGRARVAIGKATAVDRAGRRWPLATEAADANTGLARVIVPASVLSEATYPLAIDPLIGAEFGVDQPVNGPIPCTRSAPCVAAGDNGNGYLVVWTHGRGEATEPAVCAARVNLEGRLLDPDGILVSSAAGEQTTCAVASNPGGFLIVWSSPRGTSTTDWDVLGARIDGNGTLLDRSPLAIGAVATSLQNSPAVAGNGSNYLVVWRDTRSTGIYGNLVGLDGKVATASGTAISTAANDQYTPAVAAMGTNYFVAWQDYRKGTSAVYQSDIYGARVSGAGSVLDAAGIPICTRTNSQFRPVVAAARDCVVVVWEDYDQGGNDLWAARVDGNGAVLDPDGVAVVRASNLQSNPSVAAIASDQRVLLAWQDFRDTDSSVFAARGYAAVLSAGSQPGSAITVGPATPISPIDLYQGAPGVAAAVTIDAGAGYAVWQDGGVAPTTSLTEIHGALLHLDESGGAGDGSVSAAPAQSLTANQNSELSPSIAFNGTYYLAVWTDNRNGAAASGSDIYGIRLAADGSPLDRSAFPISVAANRQFEPVVASNGADFLVAWTDLRNTPSYAAQADIFATMVAADGHVMQPEGFLVSGATNDQSAPAVAAMGTEFFVAWQDARKATTSPARPDIYGARVSRTGSVVDTNGIAVCANVSTQTSPSVGGGGPDGVFVAWVDLRNSTSSDIYGAHVSADGVVAEANGFALCKATGVQSQPSVAGAVGVTYLVSWSDSRAGAANPDIYGVFVDPTGVIPPSDGFPIATGVAIQSAPVAARVSWSATGADGLGDFLVAWQEARGTSPNLNDIYIVRVAAGADGKPTVGVPGLLDGAAGDQVGPSLAGDASGTVLVLSQSTPYSVSRAVGVRSAVGQAARLGSVERLPNGGVRFFLTGARGATYRVEVSEDLAQWRLLVTATVPAGGGVTPITDSVPATARFYRAILVDNP